MFLMILGLNQWLSWLLINLSRLVTSIFVPQRFLALGLYEVNSCTLTNNLAFNFINFFIYGTSFIVMTNGLCQLAKETVWSIFTAHLCFGWHLNYLLHSFQDHVFLFQSTLLFNIFDNSLMDQINWIVTIFFLFVWLILKRWIWWVNSR